MIASVKAWGNSQGIRIPRNILELLGISINEEVNLDVVDDSIIIRKKHVHKTLKERYEEFGKEPEELEEYEWGDPIGRELW